MEDKEKTNNNTKKVAKKTTNKKTANKTTNKKPTNKTTNTKKPTNKTTSTKKTTNKKPTNKTTSTKKSTNKKPTNKTTSTKKTTNKKPINKTTNIKKVDDDKLTNTNKTIINEDNKIIETKELNNDTDNKIIETKELNVDTNDNKPDVNAYVNVLFEQKKEKRKFFIINFLLLVIIAGVIGLGVMFIFNNKDRVINKFLDSEHVKRVINNHDEPKKNTPKDNKLPDNTDKIAILTFHRITSDETKNKYFSDNEWVQSVDMFEKQMKYLSDNHIKTLNLDEFNCWYDGECKFDKNTVVLTFDDGDLSIYYLVLPILKKYNLKGTAFIIGSKVTDTESIEYTDTKRLFVTRETMQKSKEEYSDLYYESHSYNFHDGDNKKKVYNMTLDELQEDFDKMKEFNFKYIAYPFGNYDEKVMSKAEENNYIMGFTFRDYGYATRESKRFEIPRIKVNGESDVNYIEKIVKGEYVHE